MGDNFFYGIIAVSKDIGLFLTALFHDKLFIGFIIGAVISILITGFVLSKDPRRVPLILRFSAMESFHKIAQRQENGTFSMAYIDFLRMYTQIRMLVIIAFIAFCVMVSTMLLTYTK